MTAGRLLERTASCRSTARSGVALFLLLIAPLAHAGGLDDFLAFNAATKSATARFDQQVLDRGGRWTYEKPHKQVLVADGAKLWIHDPDLNQVTVKRIDRAISSTPAALLAGKDDITALFTLRDAGSADGINWVEATPKEGDTGFERVRLGLRGRTLAAMELHDQLGGRTMLRFSDLKANAPVPADSFRFTPPAGADVMEDAPPAGKLPGQAPKR